MREKHTLSRSRAIALLLQNIDENGYVNMYKSDGTRGLLLSDSSGYISSLEYQGVVSPSNFTKEDADRCSYCVSFFDRDLLVEYQILLSE